MTDRWFVAALLLAVALVAWAGLRLRDSMAERPGSMPPAAAGTGTVVQVIDGDTVVVAINGVEEPVRLIGIDTPETKKPDHPVECFGPEASARMTELLPIGAAVRLERDAETRDRFGRLLAYLFLVADGTLIEEVMLREGMGAPLDIAPNSAYRGRLGAAAAEARQAGRGLWSACGGPHTTAAARATQRAPP